MQCQVVLSLSFLHALCRRISSFSDHSPYRTLSKILVLSRLSYLYQFFGVLYTGDDDDDDDDDSVVVDDDDDELLHGVTLLSVLSFMLCVVYVA